MLKKSTKIIIVILLVLVSVLLSSCQNSMEEPAIKISYDSDGLEPIYYGNQYNKEKDEIEKRLKDFMVGKRFIDLPIIDSGDKVQIEALNFKTNEFKIYDYIMDENCNIISEYDVEPFIIRSVEDRNAEIIFEEGQDLERYFDFAVEGNLIHCLLIRCKVNNSSFAFATLVLRVSE